MSIDGRKLAGVGKMAKMDAAEKALLYLDLWGEEDDLPMEQAQADD